MIEAHDIELVLPTKTKPETWLVTAKLNNLDYQSRFGAYPTPEQYSQAVKSFEVNYDGLIESTRQPVKVDKHWMEN